MYRRLLFAVLLFAVPSFVAACDGDPGASLTGEEVYRTPIGAVGYSCETCHALQEPAADGMRRAGHPIGDVTKRPAYFNGRLATFRQATNICLDRWMQAEEWEEGEPLLRELEAFLDDVATVDEAPMLSFARAVAPDPVVLGDVEAGRELFDQSCALCHDAGGTGGELAPMLVGRGLDPEYVAFRVRQNQGQVEDPCAVNYDDGLMPYWSGERLSEQELQDIVAFVTMSLVPEAMLRAQ